jgi:hypothetical protein
MDKVPNELLFAIFSLLPARDLGAACTLVSSRWHEIATDDALWMRHLAPDCHKILSAMGICADTTPARERVRILGPYDPSEDRPNCCRHDLSRGTLCLCCTCRRHHAIRAWDPKAPLIFDIIGSANETTMARTYDANAIAYGTLVQSADLGGSLLAMMVNLGMLNKPDAYGGHERATWTAKAHRALRPPLFDPKTKRTRVCYTDDELYSMK